MVWKVYTTAQMDGVSRRLFMPLMLLINYTLLLYLLTFYWARRSEWRVRLLFTFGSLGVACLVPFADPRDQVVGNLNDISEACCGLTFLLQITIIGYDLNRKIKFRTVLALTYVADILIIAGCTLVVLSIMDIVHDGLIPTGLKEVLPNACENITLAFIFVFRYYYIVISRGWRDVWMNRKLEVCLYLLYATHEAPFAVLEEVSGLSWEWVQALWNRVTLAGCLWATARTKIHQASVDSTASATHTTPSLQQRSKSSSSRVRKGSVYAVVAKQSKQRTDHHFAGEDRPQLAAVNKLTPSLP